MVHASQVIDIAGDRYYIKKLDGKTAKSRKLIIDLYTLGIRTLDKFLEIYGDNKEGIKLIQKYLKYGNDSTKLNIESDDKENLIEILTHGLEHYKHQVETIEKLNKFKNSPSSVRDYIVIKKYNSIAELIHNIETTTTVKAEIPLDDEKIYNILAHTAWYLSKSRNKRPRSLNQLILDIDNEDISIEDIVKGIKTLKEKDVPDKNTTRKKRHAYYMEPFEYMDKDDKYTDGINKMQTARSKRSVGGANNLDIIPFIHLHRYLENFDE